MEISKRERIRKDDRFRVEDLDQHESQLSILPQEIITEILLRLPVKSLGRFRCVSKLFLSLLSDPRFTKTHLHRSLHNVPFRSQNQRLLLSSRNLYSVGYESVCEKGDENGCVMGVEIDYPLKHESNLFSQLTKQYVKRKVHKCGKSSDDDNDDECSNQVKFDSIYKRNLVGIKGSCNGLVCISPAENVIFLFNPTTGEWKRVPGVPEILLSNEPCLGAYALGYDSVNDDYKVVKLNSAYDVVGGVYSLRSDSWKNLGNPPYSYGNRFHISGVSLNGAIHWIFSRVDEYENCLIAAFDLSKDEFWDMPLPDEVDCLHRCDDFTIGILHDSLCISYNCYEMHDDIWVMREYGEGDSWTRLRIGLSYKFIDPLCSDENGEILLRLDKNLALFNLENQLAREVKICGVRFIGGFEATTYVESLISPVLFGKD